MYEQCQFVTNTTPCTLQIIDMINHFNSFAYPDLGRTFALRAAREPEKTMKIQSTKNNAGLLLWVGISAIASSVGLSSSANAESVLRFALTTEPPQLNTMKATDTQSHFVVGHIVEGLTRYGKDGQPVPGVATDWKITDKEATFHLRKNAKWSDGKPVTAKDFIFGWKSALDPKMASEYAFILYPIKNAEQINQGKLPGTALGVVAPDDYTLKITFEKPCGYFLALTTFSTYSPVREDFFNQVKDQFGADADKLLYNGPFVITKWVHGASLQMDKNPNYWNKDKIALDRIDIPYITADDSARFNFYKDNKTDMLERLGKEDLPKAQTEHYKIKSFSDGSVFFLEYNFITGKITRNKNLRKALQLVFNPEEYTSRVVSIPGTKAGKSLIPVWLRGVKDFFRKEYPVQAVKPNVAEAKKYLALAMKELSLTTPPSLIWLTGDTPLAAREAEYFQNLYRTTLGIDIKIDKQIFKQRLAKMTAGEFDIVSAGWGPDFADPMTFAELLASWNENNRGHYTSPEYDALIRKAQSTADAKTRMDSMAKAEKIALDDQAILPLYERTQAYIVRDTIQGVIRRPVAPDPDFTFVKVAK